MIWLVAGVLLWSGTHLVPSAARPLRERLIGRIGVTGYRIAFSILILLSIGLMVLGWRSTQEAALYHPPAWSRSVAFALMIVAFVLFGAAKYTTIIKRCIRHPQLTSVVVWAVAHLLANGSTRALVLFGGLGLWALIEMPLISTREGAWVKPAAPGVKTELRGLAVSAAIFVVVLLLHPYFAGVSPIPGWAI